MTISEFLQMAVDLMTTDDSKAFHSGILSEVSSRLHAAKYGINHDKLFKDAHSLEMEVCGGYAAPGEARIDRMRRALAVAIERNI